MRALLALLLLTPIAAAAPAPLPRPSRPFVMPRVEGYGHGCLPFADVWERSPIVRRFPPLAVARSNYRLATARREHLGAACCLWHDEVAWYAAFRDADRREDAWRFLVEVLAAEHYCPGSSGDCVWASKGLIHLIGEEAWHAGLMPDPAPWWTFPGAD